VFFAVGGQRLACLFEALVEALELALDLADRARLARGDIAAAFVAVDLYPGFEQHGQQLRVRALRREFQQIGVRDRGDAQERGAAREASAGPRSFQPAGRKGRG
jgi:hypothetical protein